MKIRNLFKRFKKRTPIPETKSKDEVVETPIDQSKVIAAANAATIAAATTLIMNNTII